MKDLKYLFAYTVPLATLISFNSFGIGTYTAVFYAFVVLPVLDVVLGKSSNNLNESKREEKKLNIIFYVTKTMGSKFRVKEKIKFV